MQATSSKSSIFQQPAVRRFVLLLGLLLSAVLGPMPSVAATDQSSGDHPTGEEIVDRYVEAVGGAEAIGAVESFHVEGSYVITSANLEGTIELWYQRPGRLIMTVELPGYGRIQRGFDGEVGWSIDPRQGARLLAEDELRAYRTQIDRGFSLLPSSEIFRSMEYVGVEDLDGRRVHKVRLVVDSSEQEYYDYYDVETDLLVGRVETQETPQGTVEMEGRSGDYESMGGIRIATEWSHKVPGQEWTSTYERYEANRVDPAIFELPEEIASLLAQ